MKRALRLSKKGMGFVNPNPLVGCVIVKDGQIIGEGYHKKYGGHHAEIEALNCCGESAENSTVYVTLEPCCHYGKTPPCIDALIGARVKRVVVAMFDPNEKVIGKGIEVLKNANIETEIGILESEARKINEKYIKYITTKKPFVLLKSAMTLDGKTAARTGDSKWISSEKSRKLVQKLRHEYSAIMVGIGTVLADDPLLNARIKGGQDPIKIIVDDKLEIPLNSKLFKTKSKTIIITRYDCNELKAKELEYIGVEVLKFDVIDGYISFKDIMTKLGENNIDSVLIEGGGNLNARALTDGVVDKLITFIAPKLVGGHSAKTFFEGVGFEKISESIKLCHTHFEKIGDDIMIESYPKCRGEHREPE
ncbi:MAG: bifunctional diaminohydroxyphosphoribosylaminopyrimidine deaminase/5-amino-6-(5-phosphoribosylamino)uracil reductase RibD [Firmicutes bacterium]|nr:bifunctional diaminohydroxyphosphoribosylaminopyrimidine deaminase/5-amino-6-(5-phosphoribosylamino)uracil reductase RibD [Bacillota bacterium]